MVGLAPETTYYFILCSYDDAGNSSRYSNVASAETGAEIPAAQAGCETPHVSPTRFDAVEDSSGVLLSWAATRDSLSSALHLWRASGSGPLILLGTVADLGQTKYRDTNVRSRHTYRYRATWADSCGDGPATASITISIGAGDSTPPLSSATIATTPPLHAYPNPSSAAVHFVIHVGGSSDQVAHIRIYDLTGRVIATIADGSFPAGDTILSWPRMTLRGDRVAPGYYESIGTVGLASVRERLILLP